MAFDRPNTRSQSMALSEAPSEAPTKTPSEASTVGRTAREVKKLQIDDKKKGKKNGTAGSAVAARDAAHRTAASGGVSTRAGRARSNTPLFALPMDPVRRSTAASTTTAATAGTVRPNEGVSTRAATARTQAPLAMLPMAPPRRPSTTTRQRPPSIYEQYETQQSEIAANAAAQPQAPQSNLAIPDAQAMVRRAAANGRFSTTPAASGGASTATALGSAETGSAAGAGASASGGGAASGGFAPPPPPPPFEGGSGHGDDDHDVIMISSDDVEEDEEDEEDDDDEDEEEQQAQSGQAIVQGTTLTAAQISGQAPPPALNYWGRVTATAPKFPSLPARSYGLPTAAQMQRIMANYYKYVPQSKMSFDKTTNAWVAFRDWLQQTGLWDGTTVRPETDFDQLVRISGVKNSRITAKGARHCDRCVSMNRTGCNLQQDDACTRCIRAKLPCTFTDVEGNTTYQNGSGNLDGMDFGHTVTPGFPGQRLATFQLPQPLDPWLPPEDLPIQEGSYAHSRELAGPRRESRGGRKAPPPPPSRWADHEYGFSDLSGSEDSDNLVYEAQEHIQATQPTAGNMKKNTGVGFSMRATSSRPAAFFPVLSRRQMHRILVWWSQYYAQGLQKWTIHRRMFFAYSQWAFANGWYDPKTQRFEVHFNVLYATMRAGRKQKEGKNCDRCIAHHSEYRCAADDTNACLPCISAGAPCTRTNGEATHTVYLNGTGNIPANSLLRVTPSGQNISYVNMRVPRQLIIGLFSPNTPKKYLKATSVPALPPPGGTHTQLLIAPQGPPQPLGPPRTLPGPRVPRVPPGPPTGATAHSAPPPGYMPAQPWQPAGTQQQANVEEQAAYDFTYQYNQQPFETEQGPMYPPVPEPQQSQQTQQPQQPQQPWKQPMPPQPQQLVAGIGQTGPSVLDQLNAWGAQHMHWNRQYSQSQQNQIQLRGLAYSNGLNPDLGSLMAPLPPVLPGVDLVANAQRLAEHERDRFEQSERENVRLRGVIDTLNNAQSGSEMPLDPALTQSSPFAQPSRAQQSFAQQSYVQLPFVQQPFAQQSPLQQTTFQQGGLQMTEFQQSFYQPLTQNTSQPAQPPSNPFAPVGLDVRAGQSQAFTGNTNQGNPAPTQPQGDGFTLGRTRLNEPRYRHLMPSPTTCQLGQATAGATTTSPATATQATTTQVPADQTAPAATSTATTRTATTRTRGSTRKPPALRTATGRVTKPTKSKNKPPAAAKVTQQQETSVKKQASLKELKRRRKELKEMEASGELYNEDTPIPEDILLLYDPETYAGQEVTSGSEEGLDSGAAAASAVASGTGAGSSNNAQGFSNVAPQNTGFTTGAPNTDYNTASFLNTGLQNPGFPAGNYNYSTGGYTNSGLQNPASVAGNDFNLYNTGDFTNMDVEGPLFIPQTDNSNAYTTTQPANVNPQNPQYTNMDTDFTNYPQSQFNAGKDDFMDMLGDDATGMFNYDDDMDLYGASDREAEPQPPQGDEFDMGDWLNNSP
ncbi:hypothetical protein BJX62DRAFT_243835 [Aspergillus germanicus]